MLFFRDNPVIKVMRIVPGFLTRVNLKRIFIYMFIQIFLSLFDLVGVALIGAVGSLSIAGLTNSAVNPAILRILEILNIEELDFKNQVLWLSAISCLFFVTKTLGSYFVTKSILNYLSNLTNSLTSETVRKLLGRNLDQLPQNSLQENLYAISSGIPNLIIGVISNVMSITADLMLISFLLLGLAVVSPLSTALSVVILGGIGILVVRRLSKAAASLGAENARLAIRSQESFQEVVRTFKESFVKGALTQFADEISRDRGEVSKIQSRITMFPNITKYIAEGSLVLGTLLIALIEFQISTATHAISVLTLFLAAGGRLTPAILRMQQSYITVKNSLGLSENTLSLINDLNSTNVKSIHRHEQAKVGTDFVGKLEISNLSYSFRDSNVELISNLNFTVNPGEFIALTGASGSGKTTLVDLLLGLREPQSGTIKLSGAEPESAIANWVGAIAYVPQDVFVSGKTLKENIGLGIPISEISESRVWETLMQVELGDWAKLLANGLDTPLGDFGSKISGGQRQRIGIARALYTNPKLIVLDEATSSLDSNTEAKISELLTNLRGSVTILVIAHRLSSIQHADKVVFLKEGRISGAGTFGELRVSNGDFAKLCDSLEIHKNPG